MITLEKVIPFDGVDPNGNLKFRSLLEIFQEMADKDASNFGLSVHQILSKGMTWVLHKYRIEFQRYPSVNDGSLIIKTYAEPYGRLFSIRTFEVTNATGDLIGKAYTWWVLLDSVRLRPIRLDKCEEMAPFMNIISTSFPEEVKIENLVTPTLVEEVKVRWQELDVNNHTNHIVYFDWALDNVPDEVLTGMVPVLVECEYIHSVMKTRVKVMTQEEISNENSRIFLHSINLADDTLECAKLKSVWKKQ
ncbi:MAG: thioesterase [Synergistaceae bacterium]